MKKHALAVSFAVLVVFVSTSLRKGLANVVNTASVWNSSAIVVTQSAKAPTPVVAIGGTPMPPRTNLAAIGGTPMPPRTNLAAIGGTPMPPRTNLAAIGGTPMPPRTNLAAIGGTPMPPRSSGLIVL
jgi:hypothetical protein